MFVDSNETLRELRGLPRFPEAGSVLETPRCRSPSGTDSEEAAAPSLDPRRPDCTCCESGPEAWCDTLIMFLLSTLLLGFALYLIGDVLFNDLFSFFVAMGCSAWRMSSMDGIYVAGDVLNRDFPTMIASVAGESAAWFEPYTAELCTGEIEIRFHARTGHWVSENGQHLSRDEWHRLSKSQRKRSRGWVET